MSILFSEYFNLSLKGHEDWFDPILGRDTKLFIDPFLVQSLGKNIPEFGNIHVQTVDFFNNQFFVAAKLIDRKGLKARELLRSLEFPEVQELHLGYSKPGNSGAGSSKGYANQLLNAMYDLIDNGVTSVQRFEELELFRAGFGADRIGDMIANLMKPNIVAYTQRVCAGLKIPTQQYRLKNMSYTSGGLWEDKVVNIPVAMYPRNIKAPVLLMPKMFLRNLPVISVENFWDYCFSHENQALRDRFGEDIKKTVDRKKIIEIARQSADLRKKYLNSLDSISVDPYDLEKDLALHHKWYSHGKKTAKANPMTLAPAKSEKDFLTVVSSIIDKFKHYIEEKGGWQVLIDESGKGRQEAISQRLFDGITSAYCEANNIDYSPEVDGGRGPVDFKFSSGYQSRALIEIKLARNSKIFQGLGKQLPIYMKSQEIKNGYLVVVYYEDDNLETIEKLRQNALKIEKQFNFSLRLIVVKASKPLSASRA